MWQFIANVILRNRFLIIGILTLLTVLFGYNAATGLKLDNKYGFILPKESPEKMNYEKFKSMFGEDGGTLVLAIQTDSLYTEDRFLKWKELGDSILKYDGVEAVVSEATLFSVENNIEKEEFEVHKIFSDIQYGEKSIKEIEREIKQVPFYNNILYNDSANVSLMMISVDESFLSDQKKANVVLDIEAYAETFEKDFGRIRYAGLPHLRVVIGKRVMKEMFLFVGLSILITSILIFTFFRSFKVVAICNVVVVIAVIWSMGSIAMLGFHISILTALIPPLMIVIGIPNCIFLMTKYHQEVKEHGNKVKAISRVIRKIGTATFLTNFTTSLGFLTFVFTNSDKLMEFGITASMNIIMVFFLSILILPIIVSFSKTPKTRHLKHLERKLAVGFLNKIIFITTNHRKAIYIVTICIVVFSGIGLAKMKATGNLTGDLPEGHQILEDVHFMQDNFGGSIPFEIMVDYKEPGRLFKKSTLEKIEEVQAVYMKDTLFSKSVSLVDFIKVINMAYYGNNQEKYTIFSNRDKARLKKYIDNFDMTNLNGGAFKMKELLDTANTTLRIRSQMHDIGSYEVADKVDSMKLQIDAILNPDKPELERYYKQVIAGKKEYIDSIFQSFPAIYNGTTSLLANGDADLQYAFDTDFEKIKEYYGKPEFNKNLRSAIDNDYFGIVLTGTSVVASEGTQYLVINLFTSLIFAIIAISILMAILFRSWRMVLVSLIPNFIPLIVTGGVMGWFGIPLKPSTLLVFSIAFGISVDDTIHYLAKYRQELKNQEWDLKQCVVMAIRESGLGMFYTSIVLFCGFFVFVFSQFGGTQALGMLVSLTLLVAMLTNLIILPSLLLTLERNITTKAFREPFFDAYDEESDIDWENLEIEDEEDDTPTSKPSIE